jgi:hypothetical protein
MGCKEVRVFYEIQDAGPYLFEARLLGDIFPGDSMDPSVAEGSSWRPNEVLGALFDLGSSPK